MKRIVLAVCIVLGACSDVESTGDQLTTTTSAQASSVPASNLPTSETTGASTVDGGLAVLVAGDPLPLAEERHSEVDPVLGAVAPSLSFAELAIPSGRPTLLLTVVGSCADCAEATNNLIQLVDEFDAVAVLLTSVEPSEAIVKPWVVVVDSDAAAAFGGRDRPTALVIGTDGSVLSRLRPFNRTGATYDDQDLRFGLQIASNQTTSEQVGEAHEVVVGDRAGQLPATFFAVTAEGPPAEVSTETGQIVNQAPALGEEGDGFDSVIPIPGSDAIFLNTCCEPAGGNIIWFEEWPAGLDPFQAPGLAGWEIAVSPDGSEAVTSGYVRGLSAVEPDSERVTLGASNGSNPDVAWLRDRLGVVYLHRGRTPAVAEVIEIDSNRQPISRWAFELAGPAISAEVNATGNLVVVASSFGPDSAASGEVYDIDTGELLAEFALEDGTTAIDYDTTGRFLAYVDGEGIGRWQGAGQAGILGNGFRTINW